jgi:hypothetical protein
MILSLAEIIESIDNEIAAFTGVDVTPGMPDDSEPGLYLFPYNFLAEQPVRNIPARETNSQTTPPYHVKCLLVPAQPVDYSALNKAYNYICTNPVLEFSGGTFRVIPENISTQELTSLFFSAGIPHRLSLAFYMHYVS